jgi:hypothetical protein
MKNEIVPQEGCPGYPYIEYGARASYKEEVPLTEGSIS